MIERPPEGWVDRRWSVPKEVWDQILEMAATTGIHYAELVVMLIEDGIAVRMREPLQARQAEDPRTRTVVELLDGGELGEKKLRQVPDVGEILTLEGKAYTVAQRAWSIKGDKVTAFLRVNPFGLQGK